MLSDFHILNLSPRQQQHLHIERIGCQIARSLGGTQVGAQSTEVRRSTCTHVGLRVRFFLIVSLSIRRHFYDLYRTTRILIQGRLTMSYHKSYYSDSVDVVRDNIDIICRGLCLFWIKTEWTCKGRLKGNVCIFKGLGHKQSGRGNFSNLIWFWVI